MYYNIFNLLFDIQRSLINNIFHAAILSSNVSIRLWRIHVGLSHLLNYKLLTQPLSYFLLYWNARSSVLNLGLHCGEEEDVADGGGVGEKHYKAVNTEA